MTTHRCEVLVIGSGPGGATVAALLAEAGQDVTLVEEGPDLRIESAPSYSLAEMDQKYRNGGLNTTFGATQVTYLEGRCVGGASEINAALYHRPHPETLAGWARDHGIEQMSMEALLPYFQDIERELHVHRRAEGLSPASQRIVKGAQALSWRHTEIERFWRYEGQGPRGRRQSMSETMVPRARAAGARVHADTRIQRLLLRGRRVVGAVGRKTGPDGGRVHYQADRVVLAAGAVQSPLLLRRSGLRRNVGDNLRLHPMLRIAARFDEKVNDPSFGVPVQQVEQFKPEITLGGSHSSQPHIALWLGRQVPDRRALMERWDHIGVFYVAVQGQGRGSIRALPLLDQPLVRYDLGARDMELLGQGLEHLGRLLFAAGARQLMSPVEGRPPIERPADLARLRDLPPGGAIAVSTIHLFSSLPMGQDPARDPSSATDSYGKVHGFDNLWVQDASLLPSSPGVNPQGLIMAIVRRNVAKMLADG